MIMTMPGHHLFVKVMCFNNPLSTMVSLKNFGKHESIISDHTKVNKWQHGIYSKLSFTLEFTHYVTGSRLIMQSHI